MIFKGRVTILKIGLTIKNNIESTMPPIKYVANSPDIFNPAITREVKKSATE